MEWKKIEKARAIITLTFKKIRKKYKGIITNWMKIIIIIITIVAIIIAIILVIIIYSTLKFLKKRKFLIISKKSLELLILTWEII